MCLGLRGPKRFYCRVGFDADGAAARRWLPKITNEVKEISDQALDEARRELKAKDPAKAYYTMADLRYIGATLLLDDPIGRQALRKAMKHLPPERLLEVLDYRGRRRRSK